MEVSGEEASRRGVNHPLHRSQCRPEAVDVLLSLENEPVLVNGWIDKHMNPELVNRMKQTIRARRKRHFNAEHQHTRKNRSIWNLLSGNVWLVLRSVAVKRFLKRLFS